MSTLAGKELIKSISDVGVKRLTLRLQVLANGIYDKTISSEMSEDRKEQNFRLCEALLDAKRMIDRFVELDAKRMSNNFSYINELAKIKKEYKKLIEENKYLKEKILC